MAKEAGSLVWEVCPFVLSIYIYIYIYMYIFSKVSKLVLTILKINFKIKIKSKYQPSSLYIQSHPYLKKRVIY